MERTSTAKWQGSGKEGSGTLSTQSGVLKDNQYSWQSRFAEGIGTNPEELIAAAHAGCFTLKLSFVLGAAGFTPESIETKCGITLDNSVISKSHIEVSAKVPGITAEKFAECAEEAKTNCPVSKLLNTEIIIDAKLLELVS